MRPRKYKLPKFPAQVAPTFKRLCQKVPLEAIPDIRRELESAVEEILQKSGKNQLIEDGLVIKLHRAAASLLERYQDYNARQQAMVIGAIRYFVISDDPLPDERFSSGFLDDAQVMNYVLSELGEDDLIIEGLRE